MLERFPAFAQALSVPCKHAVRRNIGARRPGAFRARPIPPASRLVRLSAIQVNTVPGGNDGEISEDVAEMSYSVGVTIVSGDDDELRRRVIENIVAGCTGKRVVVVTASGITSTREQDGVVYEPAEGTTDSDEVASDPEGEQNEISDALDGQRAPENLEGWLSCSSYEEMGEVIGKLATSREYDYIVAEGATSTRFGPQEIANLFRDKGGASLRVDTLVSVLDGRRVLHDLRTNRPQVPESAFADESSCEPERDPSSANSSSHGENPSQDQSTSRPMFIVSLVENANVIVLNHDTEEECETQLEPAQDLLSVLNRRASILPTRSCSIDVENVVNTNRYDPEDLLFSASWKVMLAADRAGQANSSRAVPKSVKDSTFVYRARRPFHPTRLFEHIRDVQTFSGVIRSRGKIWLATRMMAPLEWNQAGESATLQRGKRFFAALSESEWPQDDKLKKAVMEKWDNQFGDRETELVFVGMGIEKDRLQGLLDGCLLQDEEMVFTNLWENFEDPFQEWVPSEEEAMEQELEEFATETSSESAKEISSEEEVQPKLATTEATGLGLNGTLSEDFSAEDVETASALKESDQESEQSEVVTSRVFATDVESEDADGTVLAGDIERGQERKGSTELSSISGAVVDESNLVEDDNEKRTRKRDDAGSRPDVDSGR